MQKVDGLWPLEGRGIDLVTQPGFLECPTDTDVPHIAARRFWNPVESGQYHLGHELIPLVAPKGRIGSPCPDTPENYFFMAGLFRLKPFPAEMVANAN